MGCLGKEDTIQNDYPRAPKIRRVLRALTPVVLAFLCGGFVVYSWDGSDAMDLREREAEEHALDRRLSDNKRTSAAARVYVDIRREVYVLRTISEDPETPAAVKRQTAAMLKNVADLLTHEIPERLKPGK